MLDNSILAAQLVKDRIYYAHIVPTVPTMPCNTAPMRLVVGRTQRLAPSYLILFLGKSYNV